MEESGTIEPFLARSRLEPANAFKLIEKDVLKEMGGESGIGMDMDSGTEREREHEPQAGDLTKIALRESQKREKSLCLYSKSSVSNEKSPEDVALQSLEKGFFWKHNLATSQEMGEKKRKPSLKVWAGKLKLKQVENPSIGLDLSQRSRSMGPRKDWKEKETIQEEPEESREKAK